MKKRLKTLVFSAVSLIASSSLATEIKSLDLKSWSAIDSAAVGPLAVIGEPASGCLAGAQALPKESKDYILVRPSRMAYFGTPSLISYIEALAKKVRASQDASLIIEDLSRPRGGPYAAGHGSHQTGLDVDLSFTLSKKPMTIEEREKFVSPSFVSNRKVLKPEWTDAQTKLISLAADHPDVDRIFVAPGIKKFFCEK
ncbi:MAG: penicillin-insensitive murein endopeptidase, partial [Proteobacteria bacterium]